ncbi:RYamide neuropeptides [Zophobas morio]|uniref:RYamide n=1 Tax=Zophobas atratus TaxID=7074 RepID=A0A977SQ59_ZOPAT|nr:RYamide [Zophobas atratus]
MHARKVIVVLVYILTVLVSLAVAKRYSSEKRVQNLSTFKTMMRYGRAGPTSNQKENKVNIHPRADAFFLGPRYGKRSSWSPNASLVYPVSSTPLCGLDEDLSCAYTGISDLYRCTPRKGHESEEFSTTSN